MTKEAILFILQHGIKNTWAAKRMRSVRRVDLSQKSIDQHLFCFFGEFGYGLTTWLPYLNQVSEESGIQFRTCGLPGSTPFFSNFSKEHTEIQIKSLDEIGNSATQGDTFRVYKEIRKHFPSGSIILPTPGIEINGVKWKNTNLHIKFDRSCGNFTKLPPLPEQSKIAENNNPRRVVINIKDYHNWQNDAIQNYYTEDDLKRIVQHHKNDEIFINYPSLPREDSSSGYFTVDIPFGQNTTSAEEIYRGCSTIGEINERQIELLASADLIYATQGGNAVLSILCGKEINIIMRGGMDYPDFTYLGEKLKKQVQIFFELPF